MDLPEITKVEKIDIQNGDVLAVFVKGAHPASELERIKKKLTDDFLPKVVKVEIMNAEIVDLKVLRAE
jgi:hypothetical protein